MTLKTSLVLRITVTAALSALALAGKALGAEPAASLPPPSASAPAAEESRSGLPIALRAVAWPRR